MTNFTALMFGTLMFFSPVFPILHIILILILLDAITGVFSYYKKNNIYGFKNRWRNFKSSKFKKTCAKLIWYTMALAISYAFPIMVFDDHLFFIHTVASILGINEMNSIFENIGIITDDTSIFRKISKKISKMLDDWSKRNI